MNFGKLFDTLKGPTLTLASTLIPGGPAILAAINLMLPDDKKLPETATGGDMRNTVNQLTPEQRGSLMEKQLDVEIAEINAWEGIQGSLAAADSTGSSTRPLIALMMAWVIVGAISAIIGAWMMAIIDNDVETLKVLNGSWPALLAIVATPTALLRAYFGMRTKEKTARYSAATGQPMGAVANIIKLLKG